MASAPIKKVRIKNCGCIKHAEVDLSRLHALIGPNDSGKSTILRAIRTATQFATQGFRKNDRDEVEPFAPPFLTDEIADAEIALILATSDSLGYVVLREDGKLFENAFIMGISPILSSGQPRALFGGSALWASSKVRAGLGLELSRLRDALSPATLVRFDPDALRTAAPALLDTEGIRFRDERGTGLAAVYDAIQNRDRDAIAVIEQRVRGLFPTVKRIELSVPARDMKAVKVSLNDGTAVSARDMSEGLLYFLGFAALQYCGASLLLVEEPENGLHPSRIRDVMTILRKISETTQVILATHSPLVINEMRPDEVTVVTRDDRGTHCIPIHRTKGFDERIKVYALGELWLSYANGMDESPLINGGARE
jgi:predicted ATPase